MSTALSFSNTNRWALKNKSRMYCDFTKPPYFHWRSSQMVFLFVLTLFNTALLVTGLIVMELLS